LLTRVASPGGATFGELLDHLVNRHRVPEEQAAQDLERLLVSLDAVALLAVDRVRVARLAPRLIVDELVHRLTDPSSRAPARRYPGTPVGLVRAVLGFARLPLLIWAALIVAFFFSLGSLRPDTTLTWRLDVTGYLVALPLILL